MPKKITQVTDMVIDEISLVDRPANQHAQIVIAKRATSQGDDAMPDYYRKDGSPVAIEDLEIGDKVYDADANEYQFVEEDEDELEPERELAGVSKSAFGQASSSASLDALRQELSKALTEDDREAVLSKALDQVADFERRASAAESIAKGERDLRLTREYIAKAAEYNVPIAPEALGPVLMRMADTMAYEDCAVIHKALTTAGQILFQELGYEGGGENTDPFAQVEAYIAEQGVSKSADVSKAHSVVDFYAEHPDAYNDYVANLGR